MAIILEVRDLITRFETLEGVVHATNCVSFHLDEGETLALVGESGCGKSVTVMSLLRLIPQPPGRIVSGEALFWDDNKSIDLLKLSESEIRKLRGAKVGFVFQDPMTSLNPVLTIGLQISETIVKHLGVSAKEAKEQAVDLLNRVGIPDAKARYNNYPHQFSGGMRQRAMVAVAISCTPKILIADEPTTALDVTVQAQIVDLITQLKEEIGLSVIWITHDLGVVAGLADRVLVMYGGQVVEQAKVDDIYEHPQHPYTIGLLGALPSQNQEAKRLMNIKGSPPDLMVEPRACLFAPRCPYAFDPCSEQIPRLTPIGNRHTVACFYDIGKGGSRVE